ncbi:hypothetical protein [Legionella fairfieldensis]|uniref:hypothetical protein n=1 Tax=Legionella fairfieldensis TaxID=45064 RepID=UPI00048BAA6C|nr:hypothetical protein [Legionella fairfieldensis]
MNKSILLASLIFCLLSGCKELPPGEYDVAEAGKLKKVASGVIISKRAVKFHSRNEQNSNTTPGSEYVDGGQGYVYVIKLNNGTIVSVAQAEDLNLKIKQPVLVIYGKYTRILPDSGSH